MNKQKADEIITDYLQKIYGFAVKKSFSYDEAEELSAEIVKNVYSSLLKADEIYNIEGYIWRISEFTYSRFVSQKKKQEGISIDGMQIPYYEDFEYLEDNEEILLLRREIAFLTEKRRKIVYMFYYENKSVSLVSKELSIPEGTVKWHLNKARNELKEGYNMERKIGKLGLNPIEAINFGHNGSPVNNDAPDDYLGGTLELNIVYSVYNQPKTKNEIAEELGLTPVYIEDKIEYLKANGYLVPVENNKYTTYVCFSPLEHSAELNDTILKKQIETAKRLIHDYIPDVRKVAKQLYEKVYIPNGNFELFEAATIFNAIGKCGLKTYKDLSKYYIKTTKGSNYIAFVDLKSEQIDKDYIPQFNGSEYRTSYMTRKSKKYPISSCGVDSKLSNRTGGWQNNLVEDYEYLYEFVTKRIEENDANSEKFKRLREIGYIDNDSHPNIMMFKGNYDEYWNALPDLSEELKTEFMNYALEMAIQDAKNYPPQMQDLRISWSVLGFIGNTVAIMVLDILYGNGTFKPLTENEKITSQLIMFSDVLPKEK